MRVQDVLKRKGHDVVTISPAASVGDLLKLLNEHRIGSVVVMDGDRMVGIVSERDILSRLAASDDDDIRTVPVHEVVDADGRLLAIVSIGDVVKARLDTLTDERDHLINYVQQEPPVGRVVSQD